MAELTEFEGTVERDAFALCAPDTLEELFSQPRGFEMLDLGKELDDIHLQIFYLKDAAQRWIGSLDGQNGWEKWMSSLDEQAVRMSENKEAYAAARRVLAGKIKCFSSAHLVDGNEPDTAALWRRDCEELISDFKSQIDSLTASARFAEVSFLSTYRLMRTAEDPTIVFDKCIKVCVKAQDALKNAQEQLHLANAALAGSSGSTAAAGGAAGATVSSASASVSAAWVEEQAREQEQRQKEELAELRTRLEVEMRSREDSIRSSFERHEMETQAAHEELLARKEAQVESLLAAVSDSSQRAAEAEERGISLQLEVAKRRELEDRLRTALTEAADAQTQAREFQTKFEETLCNAQAGEAHRERELKKASHDAALLQSELHAARETIGSLELEMVHRPPADLGSLAQTLAIDLGGSSGSGSGSKLKWVDIEASVRDNVRRINAEAAESRVLAQEAARQLDAVQQECSRLSARLQQKDDEVAALERDLMAAQSILMANKALTKCGAVGPEASGSAALSASTTPAKAASAGSATAAAAVASSYQARSPRAGQGADGAGGGGSDLEKGAGGSGISSLIGNQDGSDRMMQALQAQRDRFMKAAKDKENELMVVKGRFDRMHEEQLTLRADNLELYRRLRVLRVAKGDDMDQESSSSSSSSSSSINAPKGRRRDATGGDALDGRYTRIYENSLDPFVFEEADRQLVISRLNILERGLAHLSRFLLQDRWSRHALVVYLILVHCFAIGFVSKILQPQLLDELHTYNSNKFAQQTLETFEIEPD